MSGQERNKAKPTHLPEIVYNTTKMSSSTPDSCERYRIGRFLGSGGFAFCYQVTELNTNKEYAIKVVNKTSQNMIKNGAKERLKNQIDLMRKLKHENILKLISKFEDDHNHYLVIEICNKLSLSELLKKKSRMIELEVKYFIRQLALAALYLKQMHILHRDIKTPNILLDDNMVVKLADFGLAISSDVTNLKSYGCCGTPSYMAPEVIREERQPYKRYSYEVDMWSIGVVTFVLLFSAHPFYSSETKAHNQINQHYQKLQQKKTYENIKNVRYSFPLITRNSVSAAAKDFIKKIFVVNPQARLSIQEALSHQFLSESIPSSMPAQLYGKQLRNSDLLHLCRNEKPPAFNLSKQKQTQNNRAITSYFSNVSLENLEKKIFRGGKKNSKGKGTSNQNEVASQIKKEQTEKTVIKKSGPFQIQINRLVPVLPQQINTSGKKQEENREQNKKFAMQIYQEQSNSAQSRGQVNKQQINCAEWLNEKLKNEPYIYEFRDLSSRYGMCYQLSNGVKVILYNDKTTMAINQVNKSVIYIQPISKKMEQCERLLYKLVTNSSIQNNRNNPRLTLSTYSRASLNNQKVEQNDKHDLRKNYKITQFIVHYPPKDPKIIKKYFILKEYCRTFTTNLASKMVACDIDLIKCATMVTRWACRKKSRQYIFFTKNHAQVIFTDGSNYFLNKQNTSLLLSNQCEGINKEIGVPLINKKSLSKGQNSQIEIIGKFLRYFKKCKKENQNGVAEETA